MNSTSRFTSWAVGVAINGFATVGGDVDWDPPPANGLGEGGADDRVRLADRCRLEAGLSQHEIPAVHVGDLQPIEPDVPQVRLDRVLDIADLSGRRSGWAAQLEPALDQGTERHRLRRPDGPLNDTVPARRSITVRDLLTFTWGFGMQGAMFAAPEPWPILTATLERPLATFGPPQPAVTPDPDVWLACLGELPLLAQPGERWLYNTGSQVLGILAARAVGESFDKVLRERVLDPLGMHDTGFHAIDPSRLAAAYENRGGTLAMTDPPDGQWSRTPAFLDGSGGLVSTVDDLVAFGRMLLRGGDPVLKSETVTEMTRDQLSPDQRSNVWPGSDLLDGRGWG